MLLITVVLLVHSFLYHEVASNIREETDYLNYKKCDNISVWSYVEYKDIQISAPKNSFSGRRAKNESCESVPIRLQPESKLYFNVYVKIKYDNSGIVIQVIGIKNEWIAGITLNRRNENIADGWNELSLEISTTGYGYINLLGYSRDNEMVLIDSVRYTQNNTNVYNSTDKDLQVIDEVHEESNLELNTDKNLQVIDEVHEKSNLELNTDKDLQVIDEVHEESNLKLNTDKDLQVIDEVHEETNVKLNKQNILSNERFESTIEEAKMSLRIEDIPNSRVLGTWAIVLISVICVTVTALIATCAYYIGKFGAAENVVSEGLDVEPPKVYMIPRVKRTVKQFKETTENYV